jgi:predicted permease
MHTRWLAVRPPSASRRRSRQLAITVSIIVALGVGTCISVLGLLHQLLVGSRPYANAEQLVVIENRGDYELAGEKREDWRLSWLDWKDFEAQQRSFAAVAAATPPSLTTLDTDTRAQSIPHMVVTDTLLPLLGVRPFVGRLLGASDFVPGSPPVVLITRTVWNSQFGGDPGVLGRNVRVDGQPVSIVGVIEDDAVGFLWRKQTLFDSEENHGYVVAPMVAGWQGRAAKSRAFQQGRRDIPMVMAVGRLRPGVDLAQAQLELGTIGRQISLGHPDTNRGRTLGVAAWSAWRTKKLDFVPPLLWTIAVLSLVVACASATGLVMADAVRREPEMAVRHALGASSGQLAALILRRSITGTLPGTVLGLAVAWAGLRWLATPAPDPDRLVGLPFTPITALVAVGLTGVAALVLGAVGVRVLRQQDLTAGLKEAGAGASAGRSRRVLLGTIVGIQMAAAMALGLVSGLLLRSMFHIVETDLGYEAGNSFLVSIILPADRYPDPATQAAYFDRVLTTARLIPGVAAAAISDAPPLSNAMTSFSGLSVDMPGQPPVDLGRQIGVRVSSGYFEATTIPIVRGRAFTEEEFRTGAPVMIVGEDFCRTRLRGMDPLQSVLLFGTTPNRIVGVARAVRSQGPLRPSDDLVYSLWNPKSMRTTYGNLVVRPSAPTAEVMSRVVRDLMKLDPHVVVNTPHTLRTLYARRIEDRTRTLHLLALASLIVLLLTAFSISGALGEFVAHKQREIAVRKALGATGINTMWLVGRYLSLPVIAGVCCGALGGWALARTLSSQLVGVEAADPTTMVATVAVQLVIGAVAAFGSIRRALAVDPATTLRGL